PFFQFVSFLGPQGEVVHARAVLDDGAMASIMDVALWRRVQHRLSPLLPSSRRFRMANGLLVPSLGVWSGQITLGGVSHRGCFEVFDSHGSWSFLFGKPLLCSFAVLHDYGIDHDWIVVRDGDRSVHLHN
ncbi:hypothetical protein BDW22DRAFT_1303687, partial [Trametopsis cervina]